MVLVRGCFAPDIMRAEPFSALTLARSVNAELGKAELGKQIQLAIHDER